jgi:hypothetical protein
MIIKWFDERAKRRERERERQHELELAQLSAVAKVGVAVVNRIFDSVKLPSLQQQSEGEHVCTKWNADDFCIDCGLLPCDGSPAPGLLCGVEFDGDDNSGAHVCDRPSRHEGPHTTCAGGARERVENFGVNCNGVF